jgi:dolichyl-phosphate-mannose-protein mannosyltransferase
VASNIIAISCCFVFLLSGLAILPYPGVQNDEALFAAPLYPPKWYMASISIFNFPIPIMQMSYLGCLKAWIYKPIFSLWAPSVFSLRVPVLIVGMATIWLFWLLLRRTVGDRAAIIGTILLATDTSFLLTTCFDWGPCALQHLLMVGAVLALVCFYQFGKERLLALGFFLFGLGMWDKALFSWTLTGLTIAILLVFPRELWNELRWRRLLIAALFFILGAFPLFWYNVSQGGRTFGSNIHFSREDLNVKIEALRSTAKGSALFGYLVQRNRPEALRPAKTLVERSSVSLSEFVGEHHRSFMGHAFLLALLLLPFPWTSAVRKPMLFVLTLMVVVWWQMALTKGAGTGAHHVVLMWPWPMFFISAAFSQAFERLRRSGTVVLSVAVLFLAATNLLVTNQYLKRLIQDGPGPVWTDAIFSLADYLHARPEAEIYSVDWGTINSLRLLSKGTLKLQEASFAIMKDQPDSFDEAFLMHMITDKEGVLVAHLTSFEAFRGINSRLNMLITAAGYQQQVIATVFDYEGRPLFEILQLRKMVNPVRVTSRSPDQKAYCICENEKSSNQIGSGPD